MAENHDFEAFCEHDLAILGMGRVLLVVEAEPSIRSEVMHANHVEHGVELLQWSIHCVKGGADVFVSTRETWEVHTACKILFAIVIFDLFVRKLFDTYL